MTLDPELIAALIKAHTTAPDPVALAAAIVQAHEIAVQIARMDREEADGERDHVLRRQTRAAERRAVQERCGHPVTSPIYNGHANEGRRCDVCEAEL